MTIQEEREASFWRYESAIDELNDKYVMGLIDIREYAEESEVQLHAHQAIMAYLDLCEKEPA